MTKRIRTDGGPYATINSIEWSGRENPQAIYVECYGATSVGVIGRTLSVKEARDFAAALVEEADAYDDLMPDLAAVFVQELDAAGLGAVVMVTHELAGAEYYVKNHDGEWVGDGGGRYESTVFDHEASELVSQGLTH